MKKIVLSCIFILIGYYLFSQQSEEIIKEVFMDAEFFLAKEFYPDALSEYNKLYKRGFKDNANINYRIGICYLNIPGQKDQAIPYLEEAIKNTSARYVEGSFKEQTAPYDAYLFLGNAYRINGQLDKAKEAFSKYKELIREKDDITTLYIEQEIQACINANKEQKKPVNIKKTNLGNTINNSFSNYKPVISGDESVLCYMNSLKFYEAVQFSKNIEGEWKTSINITPQIKSDGDYITSSLSYDGKVLYLSREDNFDSDIYYSIYEDRTWSPAKPLNKNINTKYWESHASLSKDGKTLFFASNRKDSYGGMDIYKSELDEKGEWGPAVNLGSDINTALNEDFPVITNDGNTLYFSSQGHYNIGGYDLFKSQKKDDGSWSEPENLGFPINTTDDDLYIMPVKDGKQAYIALYSDEGFGQQDIFKIEILPEELATIDTVEEVTAAVEEVVEEPVEETIPEQIKEEVPVKQELTSETTTSPAKQYIISPVFFGFDKYNLPPEAKSELNILYNALKDNEGLVIQAIGYTDSKGNEDYNLLLSKKRANSVASYVINKGINKDRIQTSGKGEKGNIANNTNADGTDCPEGRKLNRRVEFNILAGKNEFITIKEIIVPEHLLK